MQYSLQRRILINLKTKIVINAVKNLVLTNHYIFADIGSNLKRLLFEQVDNVGKTIERDIETTITNFELE